MYDYLIGGTDNYVADRIACADLLRLAPSAREVALISRAFLVRAVRYLAAERGIRRFLEFGFGMPAQPNVHEVVQEVDPSAEVVYVDNDPIVLAHGRMMLAEDSTTTAVVGADLRDPEAVFASPEAQRLLRDGEPVAALLVSVLHCIPDNRDPWSLLRTVTDHLPPGSYLVVSQLASDDPELRKNVTDFMNSIIEGGWGSARALRDVDRYFDGLDLQETEAPLDVAAWCPNTDLGPRQATREWIEYGGVARIPG